MNHNILKAIEKHSKIDIRDLAAKLKMDEKDLEKEIIELQKNNILCGYHALINWDAVSDEKVTALIEVKVTPHKEIGFDKIAKRLYELKEVKAVYLMSGAFDFTVIIEDKTMKAVAQFVFDKLATIGSVQSTATHFVLKKYKDHGTILVKDTLDKRISVTP